MSLHGLRHQAALALVILFGALGGMRAEAQQTPRSVDDVTSGSSGGFAVIEDAPRPMPAPTPSVAPASYSPATSLPLPRTSGVVATTPAPTTTASGKPIKPGDAVYELPFAKQTAPGKGVAPVGSSSAVAKSSAPGSSLTRVALAPAPVVVPVAPPKPAWDGAAGTDAKAMLIAWGVKAHWVVQWNVDFTFPIPSAVHYDGTFVEAVSSHYGTYTDRRRTRTPICVDMHRENATVHVYPPDDSGKCDETLADKASSNSADKKVTP